MKLFTASLVVVASGIDASSFNCCNMATDTCGTDKYRAKILDPTPIASQTRSASVVCCRVKDVEVDASINFPPCDQIVVINEPGTVEGIDWTATSGIFIPESVDGSHSTGDATPGDRPVSTTAGGDDSSEPIEIASHNNVPLGMPEPEPESPDTPENLPNVPADPQDIESPEEDFDGAVSSGFMPEGGANNSAVSEGGELPIAEVSSQGDAAPVTMPVDAASEAGSDCCRHAGDVCPPSHRNGPTIDTATNGQLDGVCCRPDADVEEVMRDAAAPMPTCATNGSGSLGTAAVTNEIDVDETPGGGVAAATEEAHAGSAAVAVSVKIAIAVTSVGVALQTAL